MTKPVTVQAVVAAIRVTPGVSRSHRYESSSRNIRSAGVFVAKDGNDRIILDYCTNGYQHNADRAEAELELVTATLEAKGYRVHRILEKLWSGSPTLDVVRIVETA